MIRILYTYVSKIEVFVHHSSSRTKAISHLRELEYREEGKEGREGMSSSHGLEACCTNLVLPCHPMSSWLSSTHSDCKARPPPELPSASKASDNMPQSSIHRKPPTSIRKIFGFSSLFGRPEPQ